MADKVKAKEEKEVDIEVITAVYKVNLHCPECGSKIKRHILVHEGVQNVEIDIEKGEIKVKGKLDPLKIQKLIETKSRRKVELLSPKVKPKETSTIEKKPKENKGSIFSVKTDIKVQTITIEGTIEQEKLISYMRRRVHKNADIISSKEKVEKKEKGKEDGKSSEQSKEKGENKSGETSKTTEIQKVTETEIKITENVPYVIHYVDATQLFSDENPNACFIL